MVRTLLVFGHLPKSYGGRQQSGLANAMWQIATNVDDADDEVRVFFCATDVYTRSNRIGSVQIFGWTKLSLLVGILMIPVRTVKLAWRVIVSCRKYHMPILRTVFRTLHLDQVIMKTKPDYLHLHDCASVILLEAGVFDPKKTVVTLHGIFAHSGPDSLCLMEEALSELELLNLVFVSEKIANEWQNKFGETASNARVISNAFDKSHFFLAKGPVKQKGGRKDIYNLVTIGSVNANKGQERVVEAILKLKSIGVPYHIRYTMIGSSKPVELSRQIVTRAQDEGEEIRHIDYLPPSRLREILETADYMILPSRHEGFGLVFLESIACGTPVVLPRQLPICEESTYVSDRNAVFLDSCSTDAIFEFLLKLSCYEFDNFKVAHSLPNWSWNDVGKHYRSLFTLSAEIH